MHFAHHRNAGQEILNIEGNLYNHIYQSRRTKSEKKLLFRNLCDEYLYTYEHLEISRKYAKLKLHDKILQPNVPAKYIHIIWAIIESKSIEKTLPYLNQIGVGKITFFYANKSQKNEKISLEKLQRILIHSCEQCSRSSLMTLEILSNTQEALKQYPKSYIFDFGGKDIHQGSLNLENGIFVGPEGGFDTEERGLFKDRVVYSFKQNLILKSECASLFLASLGS